MSKSRSHSRSGSRLAKEFDYMDDADDRRGGSKKGKSKKSHGHLVLVADVDGAGAIVKSGSAKSLLEKQAKKAIKEAESRSKRDSSRSGSKRRVGAQDRIVACGPDLCIAVKPENIGASAGMSGKALSMQMLNQQYKTEYPKAAVVITAHGPSTCVLKLASFGDTREALASWALQLQSSKKLLKKDKSAAAAVESKSSSRAKTRLATKSKSKSKSKHDGHQHDDKIVHWNLRARLAGKMSNLAPADSIDDIVQNYVVSAAAEWNVERQVVGMQALTDVNAAVNKLSAVVGVMLPLPDTVLIGLVEKRSPIGTKEETDGDYDYANQSPMVVHASGSSDAAILVKKGASSDAMPSKEVIARQIMIGLFELFLGAKNHRRNYFKAISAQNEVSAVKSGSSTIDPISITIGNFRYGKNAPADEAEGERRVLYIPASGASYSDPSQVLIVSSLKESFAVVGCVTDELKKKLDAGTKLDANDIKSALRYIPVKQDKGKSGKHAYVRMMVFDSKTRRETDVPENMLTNLDSKYLDAINDANAWDDIVTYAMATSSNAQPVDKNLMMLSAIRNMLAKKNKD